MDYQQKNQIVFTNKANCRDCYRCLRVCPVKAIRMTNGQAYVDDDRCITCGTCIRHCPQHAKTFRNDLETAIKLVNGARLTAASIAPSFAAMLSEWQIKRFASVLRKLGFDFVAETAVGAYDVAKQVAKHVNHKPQDAHICTACPAAVNYIEKYRPELIDKLTPVVSPMIAHAKMLRAKLGDDIAVIFIGPCVAKKAEAARTAYKGLVDCALTFEELNEWINRYDIDFVNCEESDFDQQPKGDARIFPLEGGSLKTGGLTTDVLAENVITVTDPDNFTAVLDSISDEGLNAVVEPLFCADGCINGPAMPDKRNLYLRRNDVLQYAAQTATINKQVQQESADLLMTFEHHNLPHSEFSEQEVREVLALTGKELPTDELNCSACGYPTCREKAVAVLNGMAEVEMCVPHMRKLAEQRTDRIIETSPNGIVILDEHLKIISMNPAFKKYFMCSTSVYGQPISYLMDPHYFQQLANESTDLLEHVQKHEKYNLVCHEILYALRNEKQIVGIFVNITKSHKDRQKLDELRTQTMQKAHELLEHQMTLAQTLAQHLGESTARGEDLLENLMLLVQQEDKTTIQKNGGNSFKPW